MNQRLDEMLKKYRTVTLDEQKNAIKEVMQEIVLCGLSRAGFFEKAAFYGGTALRIFYGLDRFSEDLDFSLICADEDYDLTSYFHVLEKEVANYGVHFQIQAKEKTKDSQISSAFLKGNTKEHILLFYGDEKTANSIPSNETIKIKFEVDTNPPMGARYETRYQLLPSPYEIRLFDEASLFAGKIHAVICRAWKSRVKGRDLYDYVFFLSRQAKVNLEHLRERLIESDYIKKEDTFNLLILKDMLDARFDEMDYSSAKEDVIPFVKDKQSLNVWSADFFKQITRNLQEE